MSKKEIALGLGVEARDMITKIEGIVIYVCQDVTGLKRYAIQPPSTDKTTVPDAMELDEHTIEVIGEGLSKKVTHPEGPQKFELGKEAQNKLSGVKGVLTKVVLHLNGCRNYVLSIKKDTKMFDDDPKSHYVEEWKLEYTKETPKEVIPTVVQVEPAKRATGGPMTKVRMNKALGR